MSTIIPTYLFQFLFYLNSLQAPTTSIKLLKLGFFTLTKALASSRWGSKINKKEIINLLLSPFFVHKFVELPQNSKGVIRIGIVIGFYFQTFWHWNGSTVPSETFILCSSFADSIESKQWQKKCLCQLRMAKLKAEGIQLKITFRNVRVDSREARSSFEFSHFSRFFCYHIQLESSFYFECLHKTSRNV